MNIACMESPCSNFPDVGRQQLHHLHISITESFFLQTEANTAVIPG